MKKIACIIVGLLFLNAIALKAQEKSKIETQQSLGVIFLQNGKRLTPKQLLEITKPYPESYKEMKKAKNNNDIATVFGCAGGFMVGLPLGAAIAGGDPEWAIAGIGAGLILVSIPFSVKYSKHAKNAVGIYNNNITPTATKKADFKMGFTPSGIGITMNF